MNISTMIKQLTESYKETSILAVQNLCLLAGVEYRPPSEAKRLIEEMNEKGFRLKVTKFNETDVAVGQYVVLMDLEFNLVHGFKIWIDFEGYEVKSEDIISIDQIPFLKDGGVLN